jgi:hypothetical protein
MGRDKQIHPSVVRKKYNISLKVFVLQSLMSLASRFDASPGMLGGVEDEIKDVLVWERETCRQTSHNIDPTQLITRTPTPYSAPYARKGADYVQVQTVRLRDREVTDFRFQFQLSPGTQ